MIGYRLKVVPHLEVVYCKINHRSEQVCEASQICRWFCSVSSNETNLEERSRVVLIYEQNVKFSNHAHYKPILMPETLDICVHESRSHPA